MRIAIIYAIFALSASSVFAQGSASIQFSGIQQIQLPQGPVFESGVAVDHGKIRIETRQGTSRAPTRTILFRKGEKFVYFIEPEQRRGTRFPTSHPLLMLYPDYLLAAFLFQEEIAGDKLSWTRLGDEQMASQFCEKHQVTGVPDIIAFVYLNKKTKLPVLMELVLEKGAAKLQTTWTQTVKGPSSPQLFVVPPEFEISEAPNDLR
jgi:hypothetical protein